MRIYGRSKPLPYRGGMEIVRGREFVRNWSAVSPLRLALRATSPVSGRLMVATLPKVGEWSLCAEGSCGRSKPLPYRGVMEFVRRREFVRNWSAVSPLRLALRATSPVSGRLTVATLQKVGNGVRAQRGVCADLREELTVCVAHSALTLPRENGVCARREDCTEMECG